MSTRLTSPYKGFTLIEILVVLGIVALLAALVLSVFVRVREQGRNATCQSNLSQIAMAMHQYLQDNNGRFPSEAYGLGNGRAATLVSWNDAILPYLKTNAIFFCPTSHLRDQDSSNYGFNFGELNSQLRKTGNKINNLYGVHESRLGTPSEVVLNMDLYAVYGDGTIIDGTRIETSCGSILSPSLHSGGGNASFVDGHIQWMSATQWAQRSCTKRASGESRAIDD